MPDPSLRLLAVNVGLPAGIVNPNTGRAVLSGITKHRVTEPMVVVGAINIAGDRQADLQNHGGVDKAVYCYPHDHLPAWQEEIGYGDDRDAPFGENLSVRGLREQDVHIGDRWQWGDAVLEVAQPRWPCFKLGVHAGHRDLPARLIASERSGWYYRVLTGGSAPTAGTLRLIHRDPESPTVRETFQAARGLLPEAQARTIAACPTLAARWRDMISKRYSSR